MAGQFLALLLLSVLRHCLQFELEHGEGHVLPSTCCVREGQQCMHMND